MKLVQVTPTDETKCKVCGEQATNRGCRLVWNGHTIVDIVYLCGDHWNLNNAELYYAWRAIQDDIPWIF